MKKLEKGFLVPSAWADKRHDGQVLRHDMAIDRASVMALVNKPPPTDFSPERYLDRPMLTPRAAVSDMGLTRADADSWARYLTEIVYSSPYEHLVRQQIIERLLQENWPVEQRRTMAERALNLYHNVKKSRSHIVTVDQLRKALDHHGVALRKADARGGDYYRRVAKKGGGYTYYYDEDKYHQRKDAHPSGGDMLKGALRRKLLRAIEAAADKGCGVDDLKDLAKKYGGKGIAAELHKQCGEGGALVYKGGRFYKGQG